MPFFRNKIAFSFLYIIYKKTNKIIVPTRHAKPVLNYLPVQVLCLEQALQCIGQGREIGKL